jgi:dTDP-4-dehydrorhamnose 3,5-epimerase
LVTSDVADVVYKVDAPYAPATEGGLRWDDPALAIDWPVGEDPPLTSAKDARWPGLATLTPPFP